MKKEEMALSMKDEYLSEKRVDYIGYAATKFVGHGDNRTGERVFEKTEFIGFLRTEVGMKKTKAYDCFQALLEMGIVQQDGQDKKKYRMSKDAKPFLILYKDTVRYFFDHYKPIHFKVYCYLLNKYNMHQTYGYKENYFFSSSELLRAIGYDSKQYRNIKLMNEVLIDLENNRFISYNHETVGRPGKHGRYKELYWVNAIAENSVEASKETVRQDDTKPRWFNGQTWNDYDILDFDDCYIQMFLTSHAQNVPVVKLALERGDIREESRGIYERFLLENEIV